MFEYYSKDDLGYLYLDSSLKINETYTINPLDILGMINIDIDSQNRIFGIEIIPASYISKIKFLKEIPLLYDDNNNTLTIQFSDTIADSTIKNDGEYYDPPINFNGNFEIGIASDEIIYFKITNASLFLSSEMLDKDSIHIVTKNSH